MFMVYAFRYILLLSFLFKCKCDDSDGLNQIQKQINFKGFYEFILDIKR